MVLRLREIRKKRKLTQKDMADRLGVSVATYKKWEQGVHLPSLVHARDCAIILQCSIDEIVGHETPYGSSSSERELLEGYRRLNTKGKKIVYIMMETAAFDEDLVSAK